MHLISTVGIFVKTFIINSFKHSYFLMIIWFYCSSWKNTRGSIISYGIEISTPHLVDIYNLTRRNIVGCYCSLITNSFAFETIGKNQSPPSDRYDSW